MLRSYAESTPLLEEVRAHAHRRRAQACAYARHATGRWTPAPTLVHCAQIQLDATWLSAGGEGDGDAGAAADLGDVDPLLNFQHAVGGVIECAPPTVECAPPCRRRACWQLVLTLAERQCAPGPGVLKRCTF